MNENSPLVINQDVAIPKEQHSRKLTLDDVIDEIGVGRFQWRLMVLCGFGYAGDAMELLMISYIVPAVRREWDLDNDQTGMLASTVFLGMVIGANFWGFLGDRFGRRIAFMFTSIFTAIWGLASAFAPSLPYLMAARFLVGIGVGGNMPIDYSMMTEFTPTKSRGNMIAALGIFFSIGAGILGVLALNVLQDLGWRYFIGIAAAPFFLLGLCRSFVPESPRFLAAKGRSEEAKQVLLKVAEFNRVYLEGNFELVIPASLLEEDTSFKGRFRNFVGQFLKMLSPHLRRTSILLWISWFGVSYGAYGLMVFMPVYFVILGVGESDIYTTMFYNSIAILIAPLSIFALVYVFPRKVLMIIFFLLSGVAIAVLPFIPNFKADLWVSVVAVYFLQSGYAALNIYTSEVYPTILRASGMGMCSAWGKAAAVVSPIVSMMMIDLPNNAAIWVFAAWYAVASFATLLLPLETRNRQLEDVLEYQRID